ncbi:hypothetical protein BYT27DRAFT_7250885 [Phlegmacium glaucopus]|nr:hypothetical protein BYT27DRAFT_7250885 [Phlegmacium glaucopus]
MLRTCLANIKSGSSPLRAKTHARFLTQGKRLREVHFLNPEKITFHKQPTVDLSGKRHATFSVPFNGKYQMVKLCYHVKERIHYPFPKNTHGHLYYCAPSPDRPSLSGSFRFRNTFPDHPEGFADGADLLRPDGRPWELTLYSAIQTAGYAPLVRKLLNEDLLDPDLLDTVDQLPRINVRLSSGVLYTLSDPFTLSLGQAKMITAVTEDHSATFRLRPLVDPRIHRYPFTGTVLARFEKSELPEHTHKRAVVIRVLDILSPIECVIPDYDSYIQLPASGQLIAKRKRSAGYRPWSMDVSEESPSIANCLGPLFPDNTP